MSLKNLIIVTLFLSFSTLQAQHVREEYNFLGIQGGVTLFDVKTDNFNTEQGTGFYAGFVTHGDFYNNFDLEYGITFFQNEIGIYGRRFNGPIATSDAKYIPFTISGAQVKFLGSLNIITHYLSVDFGPILSVNGKMKLKHEQDNDYILEGYTTVTGEDISQVSPIHFHLAGGITAGLKHFRLNAQYQYGVTNFFNRLNDQDGLQAEKPEGGFKGNTSLILLGGYIFF